jgi:hypothetical protein
MHLCVVYMDDTIFPGLDAEDLYAEIKSLGVSGKKTQHSFQLRDEGEVGDFLGIQMVKQGDLAFLLRHTGLIDKTLKTTGMESAHRACTPTSTTLVGADHDGEPFDKDWEYATVVGILMCLTVNTRSDIAYAVHQATQHTHTPKASHVVTVKRFL